MKFVLFKIPQHRVFHHIPIYYDAAKEAQKEREQRLKEELRLNSETDWMSRPMLESRIKGKMKHRHESMFQVMRKEKKKSNIRLIIIIVLLSILAFYLYTSSSEWLELTTQR